MASEAKLVHYLKRVTATLHQTRERLRELESAEHEPIAIVAMGCRFPGGVKSQEDLWRVVADGVDAIGPFPADRGWDLEALFDADPDQHGTSYVTEGGFLDGAAHFDAELFGVSPREALAMDPQQRLALELAWETFELAGIAPHSLRGTSVGVFIGSGGQDYYDGVAPELLSEVAGDYLSTGTAASVISGRIAYCFGLEGPAVTLDTACSSSLVALHVACQALRRQECSLALSGGVAVMSTPAPFLAFSRQRGLAPDGRCKAFSDDADGTGWSEGAGMVLLERLSDARRNRHPVLAVIRGSAINSDGASNGLTAPNGVSQQRVIRQALAGARLTPADVDAVEAHGTGTTLGDPIEAGALLATYGADRPADRPLWLGSIKSNIGHAQAAAGIGGVIKMVLALRHGILPRTLHVTRPSGEVDWSRGAVRLLTSERPWAREEGRPRRAGVSSFGVSGTNAHVILQEAPVEESEAHDEGFGWPDGVAVPLPVAGQGARALRAQADLFEPVAAEAGVLDLGYSLATTRTPLLHRAVVLARDPGAARRGLAAIATDGAAPEVVTGPAVRGATAFLFPGQGAQRVGMGRELHEAFPAFAEAFDEACAAFDGLLDRPLREVIWHEAGLLDQTGYTQPALFAVELALSRLLGVWGVRADLLLGHSVGEVVAAHVAGVFSLADAAKLVAARARLMQDLPPGGAMVAVEASEEEMLPWLTDGVSLAAVNGPASVVVSGAADAALTVAARFADAGRRTRRLQVSHAFHSSLMDPMLAEFARVAADVTYAAPTIPVVSNLTGAVPPAEELCSPGYWVRHVREPVRFHDGVRALRAAGVSRFVEAGPSGPLSPLVMESVGGAGTVVVPTARTGHGEADAVLAAVSRLYVSGVDPDWNAVFASRGARRIPLPTYAFQSRRYWIGGRERQGRLAAAGLHAPAHPLLGAAISLAGDGGAVLTGRLAATQQPWLADHAVNGTVMLPGTAFVELALEAGDHVGSRRVEELTLSSPLVLPRSGGVRIQLTVGVADEAGRRALAVHSQPDGAAADDPWTTHATGTLAPATGGHDDAGLTAWPPLDAEPVPLEQLYDDFAASGLEYGPAFRALRAAWRRGEEIFAEVRLADEAAHDVDRLWLHPAVLDAGTHALRAGGEGGEGVAPYSWSGIELSARAGAVARVRFTALRSHTFAVHVADGAGGTVATVDAAVFRAVQPATGEAAPPLYRLAWRRAAEVRPTEVAAGVVELDEVDLAAPVQDTVMVRSSPGVDAEAVHAASERVLGAVQAWVRAGGDEPLVVITSGAVSVDGEPVTDLAGAAVWGLVRSAQTEHPGRFVLLDVDDAARAADLVPGAVASREPQLAVRRGVRYAARLVRGTAGGVRSTADGGPGFGDTGTVLVTGASGALGGLVARHLVTRHGVRHLVLLSRTPGTEAAKLAGDLAELGANAHVAECDVADREALAAVLAGIPEDRPLTAIVHLAGVLDDGVVTAMTPDRVAGVLRPKVNGAVNLHELTRDRDLSAFVLFSSVSAALGAPGQANYSAANSFLDAFAAHLRSAGRPALSLAWGLWRDAGGMGGKLSDADVARHTGGGLAPLTVSEGLAMFDAALGMAEPALVAAKLDLPALRVRGAMSAGPLAGLAGGTARQVAAPPPGTAPTFAGRLAATAPEQRRAAVLDLVREHVAAVAAYESAADVETVLEFQQLGFDSLTALELRNRLGEATGLSLPATMIFDFPTPETLAEHLYGRLSGTAEHATLPERRDGREIEHDDPIAIVGMACRLPGGVASPDDLWTLLEEGTDAIGPFPADRGWDVDALYDPEGRRPGSSYVREGGFLRDAGDFDPAFFGIAPRDAPLIDPQQRLLLEVSWEALERAGINPRSLRGSRTGVYVGVQYHDYVGSASAGSLVTGRIAYTLGLSGPALSVDTACSSSLVALHLAGQALRSGECSLALAGGVTVMATPETFVEFSRQRGLARDGRCKAFAGAADGTGWSEGVGLLVVERLSDARRNGHPVLAIVRGSAVNQDGTSNGLTAPNGPAQQRVILEALADAGLSPADVDAVEAHGTGTRLGDPIEAQALMAIYGQAERPLWIGSIKSNIGHTQAAAGAAGVMKMILAMRRGLMPKTLHVTEPSPEVDWSAGTVRLLTEPVAWPGGGRLRRAGVSSFGVSGTNAHVILEEPPAAAPAPGARPAGGGSVPWVLSARSRDALGAQAEQLLSFLDEDPDRDLADVGLSLATTRAAMEHRAVVIGSRAPQFLRGLTALVDGEDAPGVVSGLARTAGRTGFVFSGQGGQWVGMGRGLYERFGVFAGALDEVVGGFGGVVGGGLREVM
ncbi:type I polyketide synthase, partial [Nonomuraea sp. NPDC048916]|uniref:type I polyketide synthase n=1 Tax=Nonomuraea sp. NPDC048916 TaxID=3154232 RepID=UPI0034103065